MDEVDVWILVFVSLTLLVSGVFKLFGVTMDLFYYMLGAAIVYSVICIFTKYRRL